MQDINTALRTLMVKLLKKEMKDVTLKEIDQLILVIKLTEEGINRNIFISPNVISKIHQGLMKQAKDFIVEFHNFNKKPKEEPKKKVVKKDTKKKVTKKKEEK